MGDTSRDSAALRPREAGRKGGGRCTCARIFAAGVLMLMSAGLALAQEKQERRVALIVGNSAYGPGNDLTNPVADAAQMQIALQRLGFKLIVGQDATFREFSDKVSEFTTAIKDADIALFFFAGHGVQYDGENYLLPVDVEMRSQADLVKTSVRLNKVLDDMGRQARASVIFLDACRNSPELRSLARGAPKGGQWLSFLKGLAPIGEGGAYDQFVGFAAAPGTSALDGGRNSPFTTALLRHISTPDLDISAMFSAVRGDVLKATRKRQQPESVNRLTKPLILNPRRVGEQVAFVPPEGPATPEEGSSPLSVSLSDDTEFWVAIKDSDDVRSFEEYLRVFPKGRFINLARRKIEEARPSGKVADARPLTLEQQVSEGEVFEAVGRISRLHPKEEALRGARMLARARAILTKMGGSQTALPAAVTSSRQAADLLRYLNVGITHDEIWNQHQNGPEVRVELRAKVRILRAESERRLGGQVDPTEITSGRAFQLRIDAKKDTSIGVFAWQGNDTVVRLYPESSAKPVRMKAGEQTWFPRPGDSYPELGAVNLPNEKRNHEAVIVVTGAGNLAFEKLVPTVVATASQQPGDAVEASMFLNRLAAIRDPEFELLVLPYEVRGD